MIALLVIRAAPRPVATDAAKLKPEVFGGAEFPAQDVVGRFLGGDLVDDARGAVEESGVGLKD